MKHLLSPFLLILFALTFSVKTYGQKMTPIEMNDRLSSITDTIFKMGQNWGEQFNEAYKSKDFASLKPLREKITSYLNTNIPYVKNLPNVKNSQPLKNAMIHFFQMEITIITELFITLENLNTNSTEEEISAALEKLQNDKREAIELDKVRIAQEAYAKENGFVIEAASKGE